MADDQSIDRSISIKGNAVNSVITSGDGNSVVVYQTITATAALASGANPYLGLLAFTENEADRFFGREALVASLWGRYQRLATAPPQPDAARFLAILGPSGSGKSSLARAGLVAELARRPVGPRGQRVAVLTPGADPLRSLAVVLARIATDDPTPLAKSDEFRQALAETRDGAHDGLSRIATALPGAGAPLLVLVDQFEEIYSHAGDTAAGPGDGDRKAFIETLLQAASAPGGDVSVVVTLRSDFLGATQADSQLNRAIASQNLIVPAMSEDELHRAIAQPAINAGSPIDEAVISRLVQDTVGLDGALPLLQFVLVQIWEGMRQGQTAAAVFDKVGGVGGALGSTAEDTFSHLTPDEQAIAQHVFLGMVAFNDDQRPTRRRAPLRQLVVDQQDKSSDVEWAETRKVIDAFADPARRVITLSSNSAGEETVEVTHEAIFDHWDRLRAWLADGMDDIRLHGRLADAAELWDKAQRPEGYLWRPPDLDLLRDLAATPGAGLSQCEAEFFHASREAYDDEMAERRRVHAWTQIAAMGLAVLAVFAIGASVVAILQSRDAGVQRSNALAGASRQALESGDGGRAILLGLAAFPARGRDQSAYVQATAALQSALANQYEVADFPAKAAVEDVKFLGADQKALTLTANGDLDLWTRSRRRLGSYPGIMSITGVSTDGARVLVETTDEKVRLLETSALHVLVTFPSADVSSALLSPDGQRVLIASDAYRLLDDAGRVIATLPEPKDALASPAFSTGGRLVATPAAAGVEIWDSVTGEPIRILRTGTQSPIHLRFSPDGARLAVIFDQALQIWNPITGERTSKSLSTAPDLEIRKVSFSRDGDRLLVLTKQHEGMGFEGTDGTWLWDLRSGRLLGHAPDLVGASLSPDGAVVIGDKDDSLRVYQVAAGLQEESCHAPASDADNQTPILSPDGQSIILIGHEDLRVLGLDCKSRIAGRLQSHTDTINVAVFSPDGRSILTGSDDRTGRLWELPPRAPSLESDNPYKDGDDGFNFALPDAQGYRVWNGITREPLATLGGDFSTNPAFAASADRRRLATVDHAGVQIWDVATGVGRRRMAVDAKDATYIALSADGRRLAVAYSGDKAAVFDLGLESPMAMPLNGAGNITSIRFSPDGRRIVTTSFDSGVWTWDSATGRALRKLIDNGAYADFSPLGQEILTDSDDGTVRIWNAGSGALVSASSPGVSSFSPHRAAFSPDGRRVVVQSSPVTVLDAATGQVLATYPGDVEGSYALTFMPGGDMRFSGRSGAATWPIRFLYGKALVADACRRLPRQFTLEERRTYGVKPAAAYCGGKGLP